MAISEILVNWTTASGGGKVSVFYAESSGDVNLAVQRGGIFDMFDAVSAQLSDTVSFEMANTGRILDEASGTLTGQWTSTTPLSGAGSNASQPVADATQVLYRWSTGAVVNGRFLQGRTYVPGQVSTNLSGGNLGAAALAVHLPAVQALVALDSGIGVWHRPTLGTGGVFEPFTAGSVWSELAVQRGRRG